MQQLDFLMLIHHYSTDLLNAATLDEREDIKDEIADDPDLAHAVIMLLLEQARPLLPPPPTARQEGILQ